MTVDFDVEPLGAEQVIEVLVNLLTLIEDPVYRSELLVRIPA